MANEFLVDIHQYLKRNISDSTRSMQEAKQRGERDIAHFHEGVLQELLLLKDHISKHYNLSTQKY